MIRAIVKYADKMRRPMTTMIAVMEITIGMVKIAALNQCGFCQTMTQHRLGMGIPGEGHTRGKIGDQEKAGQHFFHIRRLFVIAPRTVNAEAGKTIPGVP